MARGRGGAATGFAVALVIVSIFFVASLAVGARAVGEHDTGRRRGRDKRDELVLGRLIVAPTLQKRDQRSVFFVEEPRDAA